MQNKIYLLDAMALIYRAHFAFIKNPRFNSKGVNTSAVYGFTNTLLELLEKEKPSHMGIAFDTDAPTFRHVEFDAYKANREARPEAITVAIPLVKKLADAFRIPILEKDGFEADDVIGTIAHKAADAGFEVFMVTPDKDYAQLVKEDVYIYKPARQKKPMEIWDTAKVNEAFGIEHPKQVIEIQGLMGDSVDNIPGIPGIGPKTAAKLIQTYGSIDELLQNVDKLKGKQKEKVKAHAEDALLSRKLAKIKTDVPIDFDAADLKIEKPDEEALKVLFAELEFRQSSKRLFGDDFSLKEAKKEAPKSLQTNLFEDVPGMNIHREAAEGAGVEMKSYDEKKQNYQLVDSEEALDKLLEKMQESPIFAFDTETTDLNPHEAECVGFSVAFQKNEAFYVPLQQHKTKIVDALKQIFADKAKTCIGQNLKYDLLVVHQLGIPFDMKFFDLMLAHYIIAPDEPHNLDKMSEQYLHYRPIPITDLIGPKGRKQKNMGDLPPEKICAYACEDADLAFQLYEILSEKLKAEGYEKLFYEIEAPLMPVLAQMEINGVKIDQAALYDYAEKIGEKLVEIEKSIFDKAGEEFNLNSPLQLGKILFEKLQLDPKAKKTKKSKQYATGEDVLKKLAKKHEIASEILDYRSWQKLKSTYVEPLPDLVNRKTNRIHTSFNQAVTTTGRLSSTRPNLQNIPIRTEEGRYIRKAFVPEEGMVLLAADYSQIELRLMAAISEDERMVQDFKDGLDIHAATAARLYKVDLKEVTSNMRRNAKTVNFGIIYGISAFGLSERLGIPRKEAKEMIDGYFETYPNIQKYMDETIAFAREKGYVQTLLGRRRQIGDINSRNATQRGYAERNAINMPIQGTAADMIKIAMVNIHEGMKKAQLKSKMTLQVHDELVFDMHPDEADQLKALVEEKMKNALTLKVPILVEFGSGQDWLEAH